MPFNGIAKNRSYERLPEFRRCEPTLAHPRAGWSKAEQPAGELRTQEV
jgi:hypothetical protein